MSLKIRKVAGALLCAVAAGLVSHSTRAADIDSGSTRLASKLGKGVDPNFTGGTLRLDSDTTVTQDFTVGSYSTNTIDLYGNTALLSGNLGGSGPLTFEDSVGDGVVTLTGNATYTGGTTIASGTVEIGNGGSNGWLEGDIVNNGELEFDRGDTVTFSEAISGSGSLTQLGAGTLIITGANTYSGTTSISQGTLALSGAGSLASSSHVIVDGTLDISATNGTSIQSLSGSGSVLLGSETLSIIAASDSFSGIISGTGGIVLNGGTEILTGANTYSGPTIVNAGTLELGAASITNDITDNGTVGFESSSGTVMSGVISGSGNLSQLGGTTTITAIQAFTGVTTISAGTLALSGNGAISSSRSVVDNGTFSISGAAAGVSIQSLSGVGTVALGGQTLTLTNASGSFSGSITGAGGLTLASGQETLSGTNTYGGETTIQNGVLLLAGSQSLSTGTTVDISSQGKLDISQISAGTGTSDAYAASIEIGSLAGSGSIVVGANGLNLSNAADTFSGSISGTGGLEISGGTETLTGNNTYTGWTTVSAGILKLVGSGSLAATSKMDVDGTLDLSGITGTSRIALGSLSGGGVVTLGAITLELTNAADSFSGAINGSGGLTITGGTEVLNAANSYTGGTTIASGTLQLGSWARTGSIVGDVVDNGTLAFGQSETSIFSGQISGTGSLDQAGAGTTILTGDNNYSGGTTIDSGTLQIGNGGTVGTIVGDVLDNGTLAFDRTDATTFAGTISGTGGISVLSGTVALSAENTYTGTTDIEANTILKLDTGGSIASSSNVSVNGLFDVSAVATAPKISSLSGDGTVQLGAQTLYLTNASSEFSGTISGSGAVALTGGTETLSGTNSYTGSTVVSSGSLLVDGSIAASSSVTVESGGTLGGSGYVPSVALSDGAALEPGTNGSGTLHVDGTVAFSSGSITRLDVSQQSAASLAVTGSEQLDGTLEIASLDGLYPLDQKLTIVTADGGLSGSFTSSSVQSTGARFSSLLSYDANHAYLQIELAALSPLLPSDASPNQSAVIGGIDSAIASGSTPDISIQELGVVSSDDLASAADQMSGELGADLPLVSRSLADPFNDAIFDHLADEAGLPLPRSNATFNSDYAWTTAFKGATTYGSSPKLGAHQFRLDTDGVVGGIDFQASPHIRLGGAISVASANFHLTDGLGNGQSTAYQVAGYGLIKTNSGIYSAFALTAALNSIRTNRTVTISSSDRFSADLKSKSIGGRYEGGFDLGWIVPYFALQDQFLIMPKYDEAEVSGTDAFALSYHGRSHNMGSLELGFRQKATLLKTKTWDISVNDRVAWSHGISSDSSANVAFQGLSGSDFVVQGAPAGRDATLLSTGASFDTKSGFNAALRFDGMIASNQRTYNGMFQIGFRW